MRAACDNVLNLRLPAALRGILTPPPVPVALAYPSSRATPWPWASPRSAQRIPTATPRLAGAASMPKAA